MTLDPVSRRDLEFFLGEVLEVGACHGAESAAGVEAASALDLYCSHLRRQQAAPDQALHLRATLLLELLEPIGSALQAGNPAWIRRETLVLPGTEAALHALGREIEITCRQAGALRETVQLARQLAEAAARAILTAEKLHEAGAPDRATPYLEMFAQVVMAWLWLKQAAVAARKLAEGAPQADFYRGKLQAAAEFFHRELSQTAQRCELLLSPHAAVPDTQAA